VLAWLEYFGAKYYSSTVDRFLTAEWADQPEDVPYSTLSDPRSLNLYGYVRNNPASTVGVDGIWRIPRGASWPGPLKKADNGRSRMQHITSDAEDLFLRAEWSEERGHLSEAFKFLLAAARLGDASSQLNLANFYSEGKGVPKSLAQAAKWYKVAYRNGNRSTALNLALDLEKQGHTRAAIAWLKRAVVLNDGDACVALAKLYKNKRIQIELLRKAMLMSSDDITQDARSEAQELLTRE
jgi:TPR repeat protein